MIAKPVIQSPVIHLLITTCRKVSSQIMRDFFELEKLQISKKGLRDFATNADIKAEKIIIVELSKARPEYNFLLEEGGTIKNDVGKHNKASYRWIVDPIDGTLNFMHGNPNFCISIALEKTWSHGDTEIIAGVVHCPILRETYWAEKGKGAYIITNDLPDARIHTANRAYFGEILCATNNLTAVANMRHPAVTMMKKQCVRFRISGATAIDLAYIASGRFDVFLHSNDVKLWDIAAGSLLVKEAGGIVTNLSGAPIIELTNGLIASNKHLYSKIFSNN